MRPAEYLICEIGIFSNMTECPEGLKCSFFASASIIFVAIIVDGGSSSSSSSSSSIIWWQKRMILTGKEGRVQVKRCGGVFHPHSGNRAVNPAQLLQPRSGNMSVDSKEVENHLWHTTYCSTVLTMGFWNILVVPLKFLNNFSNLEVGTCQRIQRR